MFDRYVVPPNPKPETTPAESFKFSAYRLPLGSEFVLGKRRWRLVMRQGRHPDFMTFQETSEGAHTPDRVFNPSEIDSLYDLGVVFLVPMRKEEGC